MVSKIFVDEIIRLDEVNENLRRHLELLFKQIQKRNKLLTQIERISNDPAVSLLVEAWKE